ncbi:helix-turn-helix domain-containing protein [Paraburkholderia sp. 35.1]|uniref:helix-turn-helix domain-containing protein n=1 Tax=Paraburkholderia sp. 35.1 TaxID=2991058 RepID=UPI003D1FBAD0
MRYETDHDGNRLKATIPYTMFSALTVFWIAARRAQTAKIEARTRPGQYKGSLQAAQLPDEQPSETSAVETKPANVSHFPNDRHWQKLLSRLPAEAAAAPIPEPTNEPEPATEPEPVTAAEPAQSAGDQATPQKRNRVFYREFMAKPPAEVMARINAGTYFLRAWREQRGLTLSDAAELAGVTVAAIVWHENGRGAPKIATLEKYAQVYDVPVLQITPKPGTDDSPFVGKKKRVRASPAPAPSPAKPVAIPPAATSKKAAAPVPLAPAGTSYPDGVLDSLLAGKSPLLAWRLYRGLSLKQLAEQYGGQPGNLKAMETQTFLRPATIEKLCKVFHCRPEHLLRPVDLEERRAASPATNTPAEPASPVVSHALLSVPPARRETPAPQPQSVIAAAFEHAQSAEPQMRESRRNNGGKASRLAKMQRELSAL